MGAFGSRVGGGIGAVESESGPGWGPDLPGGRGALFRACRTFGPGGLGAPEKRF